MDHRTNCHWGFVCYRVLCLLFNKKVIFTQLPEWFTQLPEWFTKFTKGIGFI